MQKYKEINGNDYVKNSRTTINETMQSIQSMNSGIAFPTTNLFEGMKCYRTDLKKTYTLTDAENKIWAEDAHADTAINDDAGNNIAKTYLKKSGDTATGTIIAPSFHTGNAAANYLQCQKLRGEGDADNYYHAIDLGYSNHNQVDFYEYGGVWNFYKNVAGSKGGTLVGSIKETGWNGNVVGDVTGNADSATTAEACSGNSFTATKLETARTITLAGNASGSATFDGTGDITIDTTVAEAAHADKATNDGAGEEIATKYVSGVAVNDATLTVTKGDNTTTELTLPSYAHPNSGISAGLDSYTGITFDEQGHATATTYPTRLTAYNQVNSNVDFLVHYADASKGLQDGGYYLDGAALPDNGNWIKILTSLDNFDVGHSLGGNGYQKFRSGLILQWGYVGSARSHQYVTCSYPIGFNNVLAVFCTMIGQCTDGGDNGSLNLNWYNQNQANFYNTDDRNGTGFFWFAIGN